MAGLLITEPISLTRAVSSPNLIPGDVVYLRGGTYSAEYIISVSGSSDSAITFAPYPGERAIIDGKILINGKNLTLLGLEIKDSSTNGADFTGINAPGSGGLSIINCVIHDMTGNGIGCWSNISPGVIYGNVIFYNGRFSMVDPNQRHGVYIQNLLGNTKMIENNIIFDNWGYGIHGYSALEKLDDITLKGNTIFNNGSLTGSYNPNLLIGGNEDVTNPTITGNIVFYGSLTGGSNEVGYGSGNTVNNATIEDNYFCGGIKLIGCIPVAFTGNTIIGSTSGFDQGDYLDNIYAATKPESGGICIVKPNDYQVGRANATILNWGAAETFVIDLSGVDGLDPDDVVIVRNVQNFYVDIQTLTLDADGCIQVDMRAISHTVAAPVGWDAPETTFPTFGCFVIEKDTP